MMAGKRYSFFWHRCGMKGGTHLTSALYPIGCYFAIGILQFRSVASLRR